MNDSRTSGYPSAADGARRGFAAWSLVGLGKIAPYRRITFSEAQQNAQSPPLPNP
jgi:hypothetical protein